MNASVLFNAAFKECILEPEKYLIYVKNHFANSIQLLIENSIPNNSYKVFRKYQLNGNTFDLAIFNSKKQEIPELLVKFGYEYSDKQEIKYPQMYFDNFENTIEEINNNPNIKIIYVVSAFYGNNLYNEEYYLSKYKIKKHEYKEERSLLKSEYNFLEQLYAIILFDSNELCNENHIWTEEETSKNQNINKLTIYKSCFVINDSLFDNFYKNLRIYAKVDKQVKEKLGTSINEMGACHMFWGLKKEILKNDYNIDWRTPAERNPLACYD